VAAKVEETVMSPSSEIRLVPVTSNCHTDGGPSKLLLNGPPREDLGMDLTTFTASLAADMVPPGLSPPLRALWHVARGDWDAAHGIAQQHEGNPTHDWVHAHLHRVEGDLGNARYWYRRAGRPMPEGDLVAEREVMVVALLAAEPGSC
jgi:hypothetical protein